MTGDYYGTSATSNRAFPVLATTIQNADSSASQFDRVTSALINFDDLGDEDVLDGALTDCTQALKMPSIASDPQLSSEWRMLQATALYLLFERDSQTPHVDKAEEIFQAIVKTHSHSSSLLTKALYGLGRVYEARHDRYGLIQGFQESACQYYRQALSVAATSPDLPYRVSDEIAVHLGGHLQNLNATINDDTVYSEAFDLLSSVVQRTSCDSLRAFALFYLSSVYRRRWDSSAKESDEGLSKAEDLNREILLIAPHHRHRSRFLAHLALICIRWGKVDRIREGISLAKEAMALLQTIPPVRRIDDNVIHNLAASHLQLAALEGRLADVDSAIHYAQQIEPNERILVSLCQWLAIRFEATGRLVDIDRAVEVGRQARMCFTTDQHVPDDIQLYLGRAHLSRFAISGEVEDLEAARVAFEIGLSNIRIPSFLPYFLRFTAILYDIQFNVGGLSSDLDLAIVSGGRAVDLLLARTTQTSETPSFVSEHGAHLLTRYTLHRNHQDLMKAIDMQETALKLAAVEYFDQRAILFRFGSALRLRYEAQSFMPDYQRCEDLIQAALESAKAWALPKQSVYLSELAALYSARYSKSQLQQALDMSLEYYWKAAHVKEGFISDRFRAALTGARLAQEHGRLWQSMELFSDAIAFLPRLAWLGLNASKRHAKLAQTASQLACDAAASAISCGQLERAVELLDEGRAILWRSVLELRTDLRALQEAAPELANELLEVAQALEQDDMGSYQVPAKHAEERAARRRRTAERWDELIGTVRALDGFSSFLKPLEFAKLRQAARDGPIVLLNVSEYRSDALIVSLDEPIRAIPLPSLELGTVRRLASVLMRAIGVPRDTRGRNLLEAALLDISRQLWHGGLDVVAAALTQDQGHLRGPPLHVWWIPTGFLSLLPVHCVGPYNLNRLGIPDLFISSYSTTLSALLMGLETKSEGLRGAALTEPIRMLAIGVPETPGLPPLPSTREEMKVLDRSPGFRGSCSILYGPHATLDAVRNALSENNWLHACCHGHTDMDRPLDSAFRLTDGALTLSQIAQMRLEEAEFAFLSACHSARHTVKGTDEALHLASGLQVAGFKGVVGTAWGMVDSDGPQLTRRFYHHLTLNGTDPDPRGAAEALHLAIKQLRRTGVPMYRWGAFVHFGI